MKKGFKKEDIKTLWLSSLGGMLEFYDFIIFVFFAPYISKLFFPAELDPFWQVLNTYGAFAAGYLARPLGGIVMAHFGDRYGRKNMFMLSIVLMVIPTFALGLMPTFNSISYLAPILLICIRILQGISIGGELPGAWVFMSEHAKKESLFLSTGVLTAAVVGGILLGSIVSLIMHLNFDAMVIKEWAWRIPFLIGGIFGIISIYLRKFLSETPVFKEMKERNDIEKMPLKSVFVNFKINTILSILFTWVLTGCIVVMILLMPNFMTNIFAKDGYVRVDFIYMQMICVFLMCSGCIIYGYLSDKFGLEKISIIFGVLFCIFVSTYFYGVYHGMSFENVRIFYFLSGFFGCVGPAGAPFYMIKLFPSNVKFTGISFSYNIAYAISGGITPILASFANEKFPILLTYYMLGLGIIFLVSTLIFANKKSKKF